MNTRIPAGENLETRYDYDVGAQLVRRRNSGGERMECRYDVASPRIGESGTAGVSSGCGEGHRRYVRPATANDDAEHLVRAASDEMREWGYDSPSRFKPRNPACMIGTIGVSTGPIGGVVSRIPHLATTAIESTTWVAKILGWNASALTWLPAFTDWWEREMW